MAEKSEILPVKLNGKNYFSWEFQVSIFLKGKNLWGHIDGSFEKPSNKEANKFVQWKINDSKIMSWMLSSVEQQFVVKLRPYKTSKGMWDYLKKIYNQETAARKFQLELELSEYS